MERAIKRPEKVENVVDTRDKANLWHFFSYIFYDMTVINDSLKAN